jgi:hypothetical protein
MTKDFLKLLRALSLCKAIKALSLNVDMFFSFVIFEHGTLRDKVIENFIAKEIHVETLLPLYSPSNHVKRSQIKISMEGMS